jgi:hypothetical protein
MTSGLDERTAAYLVDEPGYHVVQPAVLTTGRA